MNRKIIAALFAALLLFAAFVPAGAQSPNPPSPDPNSAWGQVFNSDGTLNSSLKDGGQVTQQANWMPSVLGVSIPATYHVYYTQSGDTVVIPNAVTQFFMDTNPQESGLSSAASEFESGAGFVEDIIAQATGGQPVQVNNQYVGDSQFAQDVISGQTNIWSLGMTTAMMVFSLLGSTTIQDKDLYLGALMYTPDQCAGAPGGCVVENTPVVVPQNPQPPKPANCPGSSVHPGAISSGGSKTYPQYPLVVGQDPNKTGATMSFHASVAPTIYIYFIQVPITSRKFNPTTGTYHTVTTGYRCVQQTKTYPECIAAASGLISLTQDSRDWILNTLSIQYPKAYIHQPFFSFGGSGCSWSSSGNAQIDDPGTWTISVMGRTSGTPVSGPRGFSGGGSPFDVWLKEVEIIK